MSMLPKFIRLDIFQQLLICVWSGIRCGLFCWKKIRQYRLDEGISVYGGDELHITYVVKFNIDGDDSDTVFALKNRKEKKIGFKWAGDSLL